MVRRAVRSKMGERFCKLVLAKSGTLLNGGNSHEGVDEVVRSYFALLPIEETVDVSSGEPQECEAREKVEKVHSPTLEIALCQLAYCTTLSVALLTCSCKHQLTQKSLLRDEHYFNFISIVYMEV